MFDVESGHVHGHRYASCNVSTRCSVLCTEGPSCLWRKAIAAPIVRFACQGGQVTLLARFPSARGQLVKRQVKTQNFNQTPHEPAH